jgi:BirA family biotin operon repressor/biotin-[acetyl-CoA-carboxylase] ligase
VLNEDWLRSLLPGRTVVCLARTESTMVVAEKLASGGAAHGTLVVADEQTAGQGRHGHGWHSEAGSGLYMSLVLRPASAVESPALTISIGLAARRAVMGVAGLACDLRWPNDLMHGDRKLGGILVQVGASGVVAGVGINTGHTEFPEEIRELATSLRIATGRAVAREPLAAAVALMVDEDFAAMDGPGRSGALEEFRAVSPWAEGKRVVVEQGGAEIRGITAGLDEHGFLLVRRDDGEMVTVLAGGVRTAG